jgi:hypothetical protein
MRSRMFRISSSRLGAHTSRMGDISAGNLHDEQTRRGEGPPYTSTCPISEHVIHSNHKELSYCIEHWQRVSYSVRLYVYLTHQTGTYGSTMRNMRSTASALLFTVHIVGHFGFGTITELPRELELAH